MNRFITFLKKESLIKTLIKSPFLFSILFYRFFLKPLMGNRASCRFSPTCSDYAYQVFKTESLFTALKLTSIRLSKCHPFGDYGYDPAPNSKVENSKPC